MKTMLRYSVIGIILLLTLTMVNCQKDDYNGDVPEEQEVKSKYDIQTVSLGDITNIRTIIGNSTNGRLNLGDANNNAIFNRL